MIRHVAAARGDRKRLAANILAQKAVPDLRAEREGGGREHPPSLDGDAAADDGQIGSPHQLPPFPSVRAKPRTDGKADGRERGERAKHWRARAPYSSSLPLLPRSCCRTERLMWSSHGCVTTAAVFDIALLSRTVPL